MKDDGTRRLMARAFIGYGVIILFFTFINADNILALTVGSLGGILCLYLAMLMERNTNFEKYATKRLEWKPWEGVDYYKGLEADNKKE
jgi:hypothetical protein